MFIKKSVLVSLPNLSKLGGVSSYWNAILPNLSEIPDFDFQEIEIGGNGKNIAGYFGDQIKFKKKLNQKLDLVILNPSLGLRSFFRDAFFAKKIIKKNIPFLVFFHGWDLEFEKTIERYFIKLFLNTYGKAQVIIVLSKGFENKLREWGYSGQIILETTTLDSSLIRNFSFTKKIEKLELSNKIKILFLARLEREKGIFETIDAFKNISNRNENIELVIAGEGGAFQEVEKQVFKAKNISLVGYVKGKSKVEMFEDNHIYCLPSYSEGLPITVLESMSFGMPVVTTKVGGLKEFINEGKMGYFVGVKNVKDLEDKLEFLIKDKNKIIEIGKYNNNYANLNLLNTQVSKRLMNYFNTIIDKKVE